MSVFSRDFLMDRVWRHRGMRWVLGAVILFSASLCSHPYVLSRLFGQSVAEASSTIQLFLILGLCVLEAAIFRRFALPFLRYVHDHLIQALLLCFMLSLVYGAGSVLELPDAVWGVTWYQRFISGLDATVVLAILGINAFYLDHRMDVSELEINEHLESWGAQIRPGDFLEPRERRGLALSRFLRAVRLPFLLLLMLPVLFRSVFPSIHRLDDGLFPVVGADSLLIADLFEMCLWLGGILSGVLLVKFFLYMADKVAPYVVSITEAATGLGRTFRSQASVVWKRCYATLQVVWEALVKAWYFGRANERLQLLPVPKPDPMVIDDPDAGIRRQALLSFAAIFSLTYAVIAWFGAGWVSAGFAIFALIGIAVAIDGLVRLLVPYKWRVGFLLLVLVWIGFAKQSVFELEFDHLSYDQRTRVELARHDPRIEEASTSEKRTPGLTGMIPTKPSQDRRVLTPSLSGQRLVTNQESLDAWLGKQPVTPEGKPRLAVVACSGGGIRSSHWTASTLTWLDNELADLRFSKAVRVISASSAGSVGAAYYLKWHYDQTEATLTPNKQRLPAQPDWLNKVPAQSLGTIASAIALREVPRILMPFDGSVPNDRGKLLEATWEDLRELPLEELRELERTAELPSIVMAPMIAEDGRRLFLSNLDLSRQARPKPRFAFNFDQSLMRRPRRNLSVQRGAALFLDKSILKPDIADRDQLERLVIKLEQGLDLLPSKVQEDALSNDLTALRGQPPVFSVSGFEFSKLYAREKGFRLATAARMTATFPMITPAVYLPSLPAVRVVDSGFRDNFGVEFAADWIFQNREWLQEHTSGVVLIQIRCLDDGESRRSLVDTSSDWLTRGFQFIQSVPQAAANTFKIGSAIRNDREVAQLDSLLNDPKYWKQPYPFFTTVVFELPCFVRRVSGISRPPAIPEEQAWPAWEPTEGSFSWTLTDSEARAIHENALLTRTLKEPTAPPDGNSQLEALRSELGSARNPAHKLAVRWELGRAKNYERMIALRQWWTAASREAR